MEKVISLLNKEIKAARKGLTVAKKGRAQFGMFDDCHEFYQDGVTRAEMHLSSLIIIRGKIKKSLLQGDL